MFIYILKYQSKIIKIVDDFLMEYIRSVSDMSFETL